MEDFELDTSWEDVICSVCLEFPHNSVLLRCSSFNKGCRAFVCDTNESHSNCLDRFKSAGGITGTPSSSMHDATTSVEINEPVISECQHKLRCPLCRGFVSGWIVVDKARLHLDEKKRCCAEEHCAFEGSYLELQAHAQLEHPHACPSRIDPARLLDWENFQRSSEIVDVLSTIHSVTPQGRVLGDYVIEYGDDVNGDEFEDFPGDEGNWWTSCILYQAFANFPSFRDRTRTRADDTARRESRRLSYDTSNSDEGSVASVEYVDDSDDEFVNATGPSRVGSGFRRFERRMRRGSFFFDIDS